jgi:RES domain-containing protein
MLVYRLNPKTHREAPFSGRGAALFPGRWNLPGIPLIYTSTSVSLAFLELLVNVPTAKLSRANALYDVVQAEIADKSVTRIEVQDLPPDWNAYSPLPRSTQELGTSWIRDKKLLAVSVPSAVLPIERNILINPANPAFPSKCKILKIQPFSPDTRILKILSHTKP